MSSKLNIPSELKELDSLLCQFSCKTGNSITEIFKDCLRYIIWSFSLDGKPIDNWRYKKEENIFFFEFLQKFIQVMNTQLNENHQNWYDVFGDLFMSYFPSSSKGQFFTPPHICEMAEMNTSEEKQTGAFCSDPCSGSGRILLAWHVKNLGNYLCAEDIDEICCLMTCCNFIIHGCVGEVIWHDSLDPESFYYGWKVNEYLTVTGIPSIRSICQKESRVYLYSQKLISQRKEEQKVITPTSLPELTLFDFVD